MKRKEITKFLAMMMSVAMIAGSGVPVTAADFTSEEATVETQNGDVPDLEEFTDEAGTAADTGNAADLFSDSEEPAQDTGEETAAGLSIKATLNGGAAVDAVVTTEQETISKKKCTLVDITFRKSDLKEGENIISLVPTLGEGGDHFLAGSNFVRSGVDEDTLYTKNDDGSYTTTLTDVDGAVGYCSMTRVIDIGEIDEYYKITYHIAEEETKTALSGNAYFETKEGEKGTPKDLTVDGTDVTCNFESSEAFDAYNYLILDLKAGAEDKIEVGTGYDSSTGKISGAQTAQADGTYKIQFGTGQGPAKIARKYYCLVTYKDGSTAVYTLNILRKGYAGITGFYGMSEESPANGIWTLDNATGKFKMWMPLATYPQGAMGATVYDDEGNAIPTSEYKFEMSPDYKGDNFYIEDGYLWAKGAGASGDCMVVTCRGKSYPFYIKAVYSSYQVKSILNARATDGTTTLDAENFADADDFAALFPEKEKENAKTFYTLVTDCQEALNNNKWDSELSGKFWDDNCDSAKLNKVGELAPEIWENIYGLKDAKEDIKAYADIDNAPEDKKEALQKSVDDAIAKLESDYKAGNIKSTEDVQKAVDTAKKELDVINPKTVEMSDCTMTLSETSYTYDGEAKTPEVTVMNGEKTVAPENYTVDYADNTEAGTATVTVTGQGLYQGSLQQTFTINPAAQKVKVATASVSKIEGDAAFTIKADAAKGAKFTYKTSNSKVATVDAKGKVKPVGPGTAVITVKASAKNYEDATATVKVTVVKRILKTTKTSFTKKEGDAAFTLGVKTNVKATVSYKSSDKNVVTVDSKGKISVKGPGRAIITVTGKASRMSAQTAKITITVKPSAGLRATAVAQKGRKLQISWKRNSKVSGYQVEIATDKSFKKVVKKVNISKNQTVKTTIKGLTAGKKYYVRVRGIKKVSGGIVYGNWSNAKPVKAVK